MQSYEQPKIEFLTLDIVDILTSSGIDLPDLPLEGQEI